MNPSPGFGGSCFEKDLLSLIHILDSNGETQPALFWKSVLDINQYQKLRLSKMIATNLRRDAQNKNDRLKVCIFGFSYKKNTSDTRLSQSAFMVDYLAKYENIEVRVHDPKVTQ